MSDNIRAFAALVRRQTEGQMLHVVMADGGFDVSGLENIQEVMNKQLLLSQCTAALATLRVGGHFVVKCFDLFTPFSAGLLYLMHTAFDAVTIYKPAQSRPANSERYIVCKVCRPSPAPSAATVPCPAGHVHAARSHRRPSTAAAPPPPTRPHAGHPRRPAAQGMRAGTDELTEHLLGVNERLNELKNDWPCGGRVGAAGRGTGGVSYGSPGLDVLRLVPREILTAGPFGENRRRPAAPPPCLPARPAS